MVSISKSQHHSSQSLASLSLENKAAITTTTTTTHQRSTKEACVAPIIAKKHIIIVGFLGESSKFAAMAIHVVNGKTMTKSRKAIASSLGGSSLLKVQMDQVTVVTLPIKKRKIINKTSCKGTIVVLVTMASSNGMHIHLGFQKLGSFEECKTLIL
jgi:phage tail sheath protein FI